MQYPGMQQWGTHYMLNDREVLRWRERAREVLPIFTAALRQRGIEPTSAPEMPGLQDAMWHGFIAHPFRVLMTWIPDWSPVPDAGRHVIRIDTCGHREPR